jgi:Cu-Zn family superoxide dismutase
MALSACGDTNRRDTTIAGDSLRAAPDSAATDTAGGNPTAALRDSAGKELGTLTLTEAGQGITVSGQITGLPSGAHAIHLHTVGRCDAPGFESAGDHWNPTKRQHGKNSPQGPHLGDLPNLTAAGNRPVSVQATTPGGTLHGTNALLDSDGATVVVHAKPDDYKSQPSGNSGDRIACGVVGR